jgi:hypothetical protein
VVLGLQLFGLQGVGTGRQVGVQVACAARADTVTVDTMAGSTQPACWSSFLRAMTSPEGASPTGGSSESGGSFGRGMERSVQWRRRIC